MSPSPASMTCYERDLLAEASQMLATLALPGCRELAPELSVLAQSRVPSAMQMDQVTRLLLPVHRMLMAEASPDRWYEEVAGLTSVDRDSMVAELVEHRQGQAEQVARVLRMLADRRAGVPVVS